MNKKVYKHIRKEWLDYFDGIDGCYITKEAEEGLLATKQGGDGGKGMLIDGDVMKQVEEDKECIGTSGSPLMGVDKPNLMEMSSYKMYSPKKMSKGFGIKDSKPIKEIENLIGNQYRDDVLLLDKVNEIIKRLNQIK